MQTQQIGLVINPTLHYFRCVLLGIKRYAATRPNWVLLPVPAIVQEVEALRASRPNGLIAQVCTPDLVRPLRRFRRPVVNVSRALLAAHTAACLAGASPAAGVDCMPA